MDWSRLFKIDYNNFANDPIMSLDRSFWHVTQPAPHLCCSDYCPRCRELKLMWRIRDWKDNQ